MVTPEPTAAGLLDATTASTPMDRFAQTARLSLKMQRVKDKLDSVLVTSVLLNSVLVNPVLVNTVLVKRCPGKLSF